MVNHLLQTTRIDKWWGDPGALAIPRTFQNCRIVIYRELNCKDSIFDGQGKYEKRIYLFFDETTRHYHVITSLTDAMAKRYICKGCGKGCRRDHTHKCDESYTDSMSILLCAFFGVRIPCNRTFRSQKCFDRHKTNKLRRKSKRETVLAAAVC